MPQRADAGRERTLDLAAGGFVLLMFGAVVLTASFFMDRADDYFYEVADNHLLQYSAFGPVFIGLLIVAAVLVFFALNGKGGQMCPVLLLLISISFLAMTIIASQNLGVHPTDMGDLDNGPDVGTPISIAGAGLMTLGSALAVWGTSGHARGANANSV